MWNPSVGKSLVRRLFSIIYMERDGTKPRSAPQSV
jgi:hypothetical protein